MQMLRLLKPKLALEFALKCSYLDRKLFDELDAVYDKILGELVKMLTRPDQWAIT